MPTSNLVRKSQSKLATGITSMIITLIATLAVFRPDAHAVPSYSRQTGLPCASCHYAPPELNPFGRKFKLDGYVFTSKPQVTDDKKDHNSALQLLEAFPLSAILDTSFTSTKTSQTGTQNGNFMFPQDASLFLAGAWSSHVGSFVQVTYDSQSDHFSWDNTDIRYANNHKLFGKPLVYGITLNNNPTVEDLWNSTPAWSLPSISSSSAPSPTAGALINGGLAQDVAGVGGYTMWNDHIYVAGTLYRSEHIGASQPLDGQGFGINVRGVAPYWRVAYQNVSKNNAIEIGVFGMHVKSTPNGVVGAMDSYTDWAADFQYDRTIPKLKNDVISFRGSYIRENSSLLGTFQSEGAALPRHHLNSVQGNVEYHFGTKLSATAGIFHLDGTPDPVLYPQAPISGSANGDPRSTGYTLNVSWWPVQNVDLALQYTGYQRFNGGQNNYDAAGRNASGNNTFFMLARFVF